ncbi:MAG: hypothetical protein Q8J65_10335, partial [Nitrosomonadales bacterium]|nr:hypothetical protein [Nitrosomonadales bacterium]
MNRKPINTLVALMFLPSAPVFANDLTANAMTDSTISLGSVVVIGTSSTSIEKELAGSVDVITRDELE